MNLKESQMQQLIPNSEQVNNSDLLFDNGTVPAAELNSAKWLTTSEAAAYMRTTPGEIRNKVYRGQLQPYKPFGRLLFKRIDLDRLIETSKRR